MGYEQALKHLRGCNYRPQYCKNGCGAKILGSEFEEHTKVCPDHQEECPDCEQLFKPNKPDSELASHDCIEYLKIKLRKD